MKVIISFLKKYLTKEIVVAFISMLPLIELRGAIPVGIGLGLNFRKSLAISFIGSSIPAILIVYFIGYVFYILRKISFVDGLIKRIEIKTLKNKDKIDKYGYLGLFLFVAVPLPGTGVWSGSLLAYLLKLKKTKSLFYIIAGNLLAGLIMAILSSGVAFLFY